VMPNRSPSRLTQRRPMAGLDCEPVQARTAVAIPLLGPISESDGFLILGQPAAVPLAIDVEAIGGNPLP